MHLMSFITDKTIFDVSDPLAYGFPTLLRVG